MEEYEDEPSAENDYGFADYVHREPNYTSRDVRIMTEIMNGKRDADKNQKQKRVDDLVKARLAELSEKFPGCFDEDS